MQIKRLSRFVQYHWLPGIPFLVLIISGGMMLFSRFWNVDLASFQRVQQFHKISSLLWVAMLVATLFLIRSRLHFAAIRSMLFWSREDLEWFRFSLKCLFGPQSKVPDPKIFRTRLKVNGLLVTVNIVGFCITGFYMWRYPTMLLAWYIHAVLFFMAIAMVLGYTYLGFMKSSRKIPVGLFIKAETLVFLYSLLFGIIGFYVFNAGRQASLAKDFTHFIRPHELSSKHQGKEIGGDCMKCHEFTGEIIDEKCLVCHKIIRQRMAAQLGYHGTFVGLCRNCHREHPVLSGSIIPFDEKVFDHDKALFKKRGKHSKPKCDECHKKEIKENGGVYYLGSRYGQCIDCHKDPHFANEFGAVCETCHDEFGWLGNDVNFDHNRDSKYRLDGKHVTTECRKCHPPAEEKARLGTARFRGLKTACPDCHKDPHLENELGRECEKCHTLRSWVGNDVNFDHNRDSKYRLDGKHVTTECRKCHKPAEQKAPLGTARFRGLKAACPDCHKDPHFKNELGLNCEKCHTIRSWVGNDVNFDHNRDSKYSLDGKHQKVECKKCHMSAREKDPLGAAVFKGLKTNCLACHKDPHFKNEFGKTCTECHNARSWVKNDVSFQHNRDSKYRLDGKHLQTACDKCHIPPRANDSLAMAQFKGLKTECFACHREPHRFEYERNCVTCHTVDKWPVPKNTIGFDHTRDTKYPLKGRHLLTKCIICHNDYLLDKLGAAKMKGFESSCLVCHTDPHQDGLGQNCRKCHNADGWKGEHLMFDHNIHSAYQIDRIHQQVPCVKCHKDNYYKPIEANCQSRLCHPDKKPPWEYDRHGKK